MSVQKSDSRTYVEIDVRKPIPFPIPISRASQADKEPINQGPLATIPDPIPFFYNDVEPSVAAHAASLLLPHAVEAFFTTTQHDGCAEFPVTYVVCNNDQALTVEYQQSAIEVARSREGRGGGREAVEVVTLESGHSPFLSMPEETVKVILKAAGEKRE